MNNFKTIAANAAKKYTNLQESKQKVFLEESLQIASLILSYSSLNEYTEKEHIGSTKNYDVHSIDPEIGLYHLTHKKTGKKTSVEINDNYPNNTTKKIKRDLHGQAPNSDIHSLARKINKHLQGHEAGEMRRDLKKEGVEAIEEKISVTQMKEREHIVKSMKKNFGDFRKRYGEKAKSVMYAVATNQAKNEEVEDEDCYLDLDENDMHYCAKHVFSDIFGEGLVLEGQHAEPDEDGEIDWYMVEFADGIRKIPTHKLEIMVAEYHMNHKKKKKMMEGLVSEANDVTSHAVKLTMKADQHFDPDSEDKPSTSKKQALDAHEKALNAHKKALSSITPAHTHGSGWEAKPENKKEIHRNHIARHENAIEHLKSIKEANDGNLANNYPPYDKVTKGDVVAGRLGKDQQGGKKKVWDKNSKNRGMK